MMIQPLHWRKVFGLASIAATACLVACFAAEHVCANSSQDACVSRVSEEYLAAQRFLESIRIADRESAHAELVAQSILVNSSPFREAVVAEMRAHGWSNLDDFIAHLSNSDEASVVRVVNLIEGVVHRIVHNMGPPDSPVTEARRAQLARDFRISPAQVDDLISQWREMSEFSLAHLERAVFEQVIHRTEELRSDFRPRSLWNRIYESLSRRNRTMGSTPVGLGRTHTWSDQEFRTFLSLNSARFLSHYFSRHREMLSRLTPQQIEWVLNSSVEGLLEPAFRDYLTRRRQMLVEAENLASQLRQLEMQHHSASIDSELANLEPKLAVYERAHAANSPYRAADRSAQEHNLRSRRAELMAQYGLLESAQRARNARALVTAQEELISAHFNGSGLADAIRTQVSEAIADTNESYENFTRASLSSGMGRVHAPSNLYAVIRSNNVKDAISRLRLILKDHRSTRLTRDQVREISQAFERFNEFFGVHIRQILDWRPSVGVEQSEVDQALLEFRRLKARAEELEMATEQEARPIFQQVAQVDAELVELSRLAEAGGELSSDPTLLPGLQSRVNALRRMANSRLRLRASLDQLNQNLERQTLPENTQVQNEPRTGVRAEVVTDSPRQAAETENEVSSGQEGRARRHR